MFGFGRKSAEEQMIDAIVQDMVETAKAIAPNIKGKLLALHAKHTEIGQSAFLLPNMIPHHYPNKR